LLNTDTYVLLACDGVWDVMTDQEAIEFIDKKAKEFEAQILESKRKGNAPAAAGADDAAAADAATDVAAPAEPSSDGVAAAASSASASASDSAASPSASSSVDSLTQAEYNEVLHLTSKALVREALDRRSLDNVTVLIIQLNPPQRTQMDTTGEDSAAAAGTESSETGSADASTNNDGAAAAAPAASASESTAAAAAAQS
jgi:serine/threonine protein phosphatase PrpC